MLHRMSRKLTISQPALLNAVYEEANPATECLVISCSSMINPGDLGSFETLIRSAAKAAALAGPE